MSKSTRFKEDIRSASETLALSLGLGSVNY